MTDSNDALEVAVDLDEKQIFAAAEVLLESIKTTAPSVAAYQTVVRVFIPLHLLALELRRTLNLLMAESKTAQTEANGLREILQCITGWLNGREYRYIHRDHEGCFAASERDDDQALPVFNTLMTDMTLDGLALQLATDIVRIELDGSPFSLTSDRGWVNVESGEYLADDWSNRYLIAALNALHEGGTGQ